MSWHLEQRLVPAPLFPSLLSCQPICLYLAFVLGTLIDRFQHFHFIFLPNMSYIYLFSICAGHSNWPRPVPEPLFHFSSHLYLAFVLGTLIDQSQHRLSGLKSNSLRLFTSIWLACILSITVLVILIGILYRSYSLHRVSLHLYVTLDITCLFASWFQYNVIESHSRLVIAVEWCQCWRCPSFQSQSVNSIVDAGCCFISFAKGALLMTFTLFARRRGKNI